MYFSREIGTVPSRELYKFFDREGNTLVLRPDVTPSIARAVAKYFHRRGHAGPAVLHGEYLYQQFGTARKIKGDYAAGS